MTTVEPGLDGFPGTPGAGVITQIVESVIEQVALSRRHLQVVDVDGMPEFADQIEPIGRTQLIHTVEEPPVEHDSDPIDRPRADD